MPNAAFDDRFAALTGHNPFPWQRELYSRFIADRADNIPPVADLPTGLGKTSVVAVWLLALIDEPARIPRRLVYVVNRRTVVDQTTAEVTRYCERVKELEDDDPLRCMVERLGISTLRGQFADNAEWSVDPSRPAVVCGTVDMIGSRLLFSGYRIGFKRRPLHAGFLGQDALLVHDEAHLEPAFQQLVDEVEREQSRERERGVTPPWPRLHVMALSATARSGDAVLGLTENDLVHPVVSKRVNATKALHLHSCEDEKKDLVTDLVARATTAQLLKSDTAILVFVRLLRDAERVAVALRKTLCKASLPDHVATLTGTMRGLERDQLVRDEKFIRFLPETDRPAGVTPATGTVYLVCTSAGEVGVNLSADHMVCDLSTLDSMVQRLGRVNRFGERDDTRVDVAHPTSFGSVDKKTGELKASEIDKRRSKTLDLLRKLPELGEDEKSGKMFDSSPGAFGRLPADSKERFDAFAPGPTILPASDVLFDAWALTTIKDELPGRPPVAPYLHGIAEWEPSRTSIAWREEVDLITEELIDREGRDLPEELLDDYPLKPHELLNDRTDRVYEALHALIAEPKKSVKGAKREAALERGRGNAKARVWLIDDGGSVAVTTLGKLLEADKKRVIEELTDAAVLLPPAVGGLSNGMLDGNSAHANDVADRWLDEQLRPRRGREWDDAPAPTYDDAGKTRPMALIRTIDTKPFADEFAPPGEEPSADAAGDLEAAKPAPTKSRRFWHWYARPRCVEDATRASARPITLEHHTNDVVERVMQILDDLRLPKELERAAILAAKLHDLGKKREIWQRGIGNPNPAEWYAKPGKPDGAPRWRPRRLSGYRHELGSVLDLIHSNAEFGAELSKLDKTMRDVVLHIIAAHHGYARPHFLPDGYDHERYNQQQNEQTAYEAMRRFARLQRRFGRWGLAYLESLLRAADWAASANPTEPVPQNGGDA